MTEQADLYWDAEVLLTSAEQRTEDAEWAGRIRAGDEAAFNAFYDRYADRTYGYLCSILPGDEAAVRDAFQETMLRVVRYIKPMPDRALWGWLTRVARTALYDQLRKRKRRAAHERAYQDEPTVGPDADSPAAQERMLTVLRAAMDALGADERDLLEAYYFRRESQDAIAARTGRTRKAVESRLARVRASLRQHVKDVVRRDEA